MSQNGYGVVVVVVVVIVVVVVLVVVVVVVLKMDDLEGAQRDRQLAHRANLIDEGLYLALRLLALVLPSRAMAVLATFI